MISGVQKVIVPVDDQERAKDFWTNRLGFSVASDDRHEGGRWLEVAPPDGTPLLVLTPRPPDAPRREVDERLPHSDLFFTCADIEETHRELTGRGVRFHTLPTRMPFGWWAMFEDDAGTRYVLTQGPE